MTITIDSVIYSNDLDLFQILHVLHCLVFFAGDVKPVSPSFQAVSTFFDVNVFRKVVSGVIGYLLRKLSFKFKLIILVQDIWINSFRVTNSTMFCQFLPTSQFSSTFQVSGLFVLLDFFDLFFDLYDIFLNFRLLPTFRVLSVFLVFLFCRSFLRCKNFYFISHIF